MIRLGNGRLKRPSLGMSFADDAGDELDVVTLPLHEGGVHRRAGPGTTRLSGPSQLRCEVRVSDHSSGQQSPPKDGSADSSTRSPRNIASASATCTQMSPSV